MNARAIWWIIVIIVIVAIVWYIVASQSPSGTELPPTGTGTPYQTDTGTGTGVIDAGTSSPNTNQVPQTGS